MVNDEELKLLEQLAFGDISERDFLNSYPINLTQEKSYLTNLINATTKEKDGENLDLLLDAIASLELYKDFDYQSAYRKLIKENWHRMHENLVDSLDKTAPNEDCFIHVLNQTYDYYADGVEDFMVPIWSKCLWSLYEVKSEKSIETIKQHVDSEYIYLKETAKDLLSRVS